MYPVIKGLKRRLAGCNKNWNRIRTKMNEVCLMGDFQMADHKGAGKPGKLAVFFPGIGYTVDKPLLYYSRKIAAELGYEIKLLPYQGFPAKIQGDAGRMQKSFQIALSQAQEMLSETDFSAYDEILFVGKSIRTIVAAKIASDLEREGTYSVNLLYPAARNVSVRTWKCDRFHRIE